MAEKYLIAQVSRKPGGGRRRAAISQFAPSDDSIRAEAAKYSYLRDITLDDAAKAIGMAPRTLKIKLGAPGTFRLSELRMLCDLLAIPPEDAVAFVLPCAAAVKEEKKGRK